MNRRVSAATVWGEPEKARCVCSWGFVAMTWRYRKVMLGGRWAWAVQVLMFPAQPESPVPWDFRRLLPSLDPECRVGRIAWGKGVVTGEGQV